MRWPGGNFVADYNWMDGIGPQEDRPTKVATAWRTTASNQVGTDEWVQLTEAMGAENMLCINMGTGTLADAMSWLEYTNGDQDTYYADLRRQYGNAEPFDIEYWGLGNEANIDWVEWNWEVIKALSGTADYLSMHRYWNDYYTLVGERAMDLEEKIHSAYSQIKMVQEVYQTERPMHLAFDEWAAFPRDFISVVNNGQFFNAFIRNADAVKMANYTLFTSILSGDPASGELYKTPLFHLFKLFSTNCRGVSLDTYVQSDTFGVNAFYDDIPYLDVSTVLNENGQLVINVINRHQTDQIETEIRTATGNFAGRATVSELYMEDPYATFSYAGREQYGPATKEIDAAGTSFTYSFLPHSVTQIIVPLE